MSIPYCITLGLGSYGAGAIALDIGVGLGAGAVAPPAPPPPTAVERTGGAGGYFGGHYDLPRWRIEELLGQTKYLKHRRLVDVALALMIMTED